MVKINDTYSKFLANVLSLREQTEGMIYIRNIARNLTEGVFGLLLLMFVCVVLFNFVHFCPVEIV